MAGMLGKLGCELPVDLMGAGIGNPKGHWEPDGVVAANDRVLASLNSRWDDWTRLDPEAYVFAPDNAAVEEARAALRSSYADASLFVLKDPRICRLLPMWFKAFEAEEVDPVFVVCIRHPALVAASLGARDGMEPGYAQLLWLRHTLQAEAETRASVRVICTFEQLMQDWSGLASRIQVHLALTWPIMSDEGRHELEEFLAPTELPGVHAPALPEVLPWADRAYTVLSRWACDREDRVDDEELDQLLSAFDSAGEGLKGLFRPGSQSLGAGGGHTARDALASAESELSIANERLHAALASQTAATALLKSVLI
jgi:hypothetical protein